jgi:nitrogen regulatory protein PII
MKRIEVVMNSSALDLDAFKEAAPWLGISEYDVSDVLLSPSVAVKECRRWYRGQDYIPELVSGVKVEFVAFDEDARKIAQKIFTLVAPERIAIFPLDKIIGASPDSVRPVLRRSIDPSASETVSFAQ